MNHKVQPVKKRETGEAFFNKIRSIILFFTYISGAAVFVMILVTTADVVLRIFNIGIAGAYDIVRIAGVTSIAFALPYVTAVKGHVAIEFFYHNFSLAGRIILDSLFRIITLSLFGILIYRNILYSFTLFKSAQVMPTLKIPVFWIPVIIAVSLTLVCITVFYHLIHPGKEMIKP